MKQAARSSTSRATLMALGLEDAASWVQGEDNGHLCTRGDKAARWRWITARPLMLFAYCSGEEVLYIGRSHATLSKLFAPLADAAPDSSDAAINGAIRKLLKSGKEVRILVWADLPPLSWGGLAIDLAAGIEASLIAFFQPSWNKN